MNTFYDGDIVMINFGTYKGFKGRIGHWSAVCNQYVVIVDKYTVQTVKGVCHDVHRYLKKLMFLNLLPYSW